MKRLIIGPRSIQTLFVLLFSLLPSSPTVHAQGHAPTGIPLTLPPGPLVNPVPDNTRWTLTATINTVEAAKLREKLARAKHPTLAKDSKSASLVVGEQVGDKVHVLSVMANGVKEETWAAGTMAATRSTGTNGLVYSTGSIEKVPVPTWLSQDTLVDIRKQGQKSYLVFRSRILPTGIEVVQDLEAQAQGKALDTESLKVDATAVIDADTRLPITVTEGATTTTYKFEPLAPGTQIIPAVIQTDLDERKKGAHDSVRESMRP